MTRCGRFARAIFPSEVFGDDCASVLPQKQWLSLLRKNAEKCLPSKIPPQKTKARLRAGLLQSFGVGLLRQLCNLMHKSRNLSARRDLVNDIALSGFHQLRLGACHCLECCVAVTALDRFFDRSDRAAHLGAAGFIDDGAAGNLARRLLGGRRIGHVLKCPSAVTDRRWAKCLPTVCLIDADCFGCPVENASRKPVRVATLKRTAAAGLGPPPIEGSYRGRMPQRQRFLPLNRPPGRPLRGLIRCWRG